MEALKVLQLADHSEIISGGAVQMLLLAGGLRERGHDVTCVFNGAPSPLEHTLRQVEEAGARLVRFPMHKKSRSAELRDFVARERFDVIHTHRASWKVLLRSCGDLELPVVVVKRGHSRPVRARELQRLCHPAGRAIVVVASHIKDVLVCDGIASERIEVVYGGFLPERFDRRIDGSQVRRQLLGRDAETTKLVGIVAKLSRYKSHDVFLQGAGRVLLDFPAVRFAIVGPDPHGVRERLEAHALGVGRRLGVPLTERLLFTGPRQDIPQLLSALDVSVSASATAWEGLSGIMRESLAMARPVVCTDVGGNRELVRHGETGLLVPPGDARALSDAILELLRNTDRARDLAENGYRLVQEKFSNDARARRMEALYRRLMEEAPAAS
ncbi:MAG: glycosyltransferase family 4 protein [Candidatus Krumholzibacteriia bacterium]